MRLIKFIILFVFILSFQSLSVAENQMPEKTKESQDQKWESTKEDLDKNTNPQKNSAKINPIPSANSSEETSSTYREKYNQSLLGTYSLLDMWIPGKWGVSYSYHPSANGSFEIEYLRGKLSPFIFEELGTITDQRLTLMYRSYSQRNSFNFLYGINYSSLKLQLGSEILATVTTGDPGAFDLISIKTLGLTWGMGSRWNLNRFLISVDWLVLNIPIIALESEAPFINATSDSSRKDDAQEILDFAKGIPTLAIAKIQLGISF